MPTATAPEPDFVLPPPYQHEYSGKVRDLWRAPDNSLIFVASDRISAYDWILPTPIPDKGKLLTATSLWWFDQLSDICPNHLVSTDVPDVVAGRAMKCRPLNMVDVECVARGYLTGSGMADYQATGAVCGISLPDGLVEAQQLPEPIFTPATKAALGDHDENIGFDQVVQLVGSELAEQLREVTLRLYRRAHVIARERGFILADTKFEFGIDEDGQLRLADEALTPDSSRYWDAGDYKPGRVQDSFDKQIVRNWLTSPESGWDRNGSLPPPMLPEDVVTRTHSRYQEVYDRLSGQ